MTVIKNIRSAVCPSEKGIDEIPAAAIAMEGGRIAWIGPEKALPIQFQSDSVIDGAGHTALPGLVDCHTHLAFAGWRSAEFDKRNTGCSYQTIAAAGGGIMSTVRLTRAASEEALYARCREHIAEMLARGTTTIEAKSGYGLSIDDELKQLRVYARLRKERVVNLASTFLGAHTVPAEFREKREEYVKLIIEEMIPRVVRECAPDFCDVFVEEGAFTVDEARRILGCAAQWKLGLKVHADQLSRSGGTALAAEMKAISADHLEFATQEDLERLARSGGVAVLLPFAALNLRVPHVPAERLRKAGVTVAVATDFNPGSAPSFDLCAALNLACTQSGLTSEEALRAATMNAAKAIGRADTVGRIAVGYQADIALFACEDWREIFYRFSHSLCRATILGGRTV